MPVLRFQPLQRPTERRHLAHLAGAGHAVYGRSAQQTRALGDFDAGNAFGDGGELNLPNLSLDIKIHSSRERVFSVGGQDVCSGQAVHLLDVKHGVSLPEGDFPLGVLAFLVRSRPCSYRRIVSVLVMLLA
jgi:hypothetical protein